MVALAARSAFRVATPLRQQLRRYATDPAPPAGKGSNTLLYSVAGLGAAGGAYYYYNSAGKVGSGTAAAAASAASAKKAFTGGDQGFVSLKLDEIKPVNHNTKILRFKLPEDDMVSGLHVASAILTKHQAPGAEKPVLRPYTPINDEDARGYLDLLVKKYEGGPMSTHLHSLAPGQSLDIKGPLPKYAWAPNKHEHIGLVAGGTGITPMYQLLRAIFQNPDDRTKVTLVFGNVAEQDILLRDELAALENTYPQRFRAFYVLDNPPRQWSGAKGYVTKDLLKTVLPEPASGDVKVFVCGPPGLMKAVSGPKVSPQNQGELTGILKELGYSPDQVYKF